MATYRALRDFGSHLGNHRKGDTLSLPDGALPLGFEGLVERVADPKPTYVTKDVPSASGRPDDAPSDADSEDSPAVDPVPPLRGDESADLPPTYDDKMLRSRGNR